MIVFLRIYTYIYIYMQPNLQVSTHTHKVVADNGTIPDDLDREIKIARNIPLDENRGEGIHRSTNLSKVHALASGSGWTMASARNKHDSAL